MAASVPWTVMLASDVPSPALKFRPVIEDSDTVPCVAERHL